jgi:ribokinase
MPRPAQIVVVGSAGIDLTVRSEHIPAIGETVIGGTSHQAGGGKGANQAVAAARVGAKVAFVGRVGSDDFGDKVLAGLKRDAIDVRSVTRDGKAATAIAFIFVGAKGENSIAVASGANLRLAPRHVRAAKALFRPGRVLLVQLETPLAPLQAALALARKARMPVVLNPAPARALPNALLRQIDYLTPNEHEAEALTGIRVRSDAAAARAAQALRRRGARTVLVTLGARGVFVSSEELRRRVPAFKSKPIDTTAAGDIFSGAFAVAIAEGMPLLQSVRFAQAAAAISVTRLGAQSSAPTRAEIERLLRLKKNQGFTPRAQAS